MVSIISTSLESRSSPRPYKPPKLKANRTISTRKSSLDPSRPRPAFCVQPMALANGASTGAHLRNQSSSEEEETAADSRISSPSTPPTPFTLRAASRPRPQEHIVKLSSLEHCMPRAYIRMCLAYKVPTLEAEGEALTRLDAFVRRIIDAKPYLAGWVVPARDPGPEGKMEVRFTLDDLNEFPTLQTRRLTREEVPFDYDQLNLAGLPPSVIKPDLVSALSESADENRAPVFRVQANLVVGGLIVSFYLHHCISDGTGMGLLICGAILNDDFTFKRDLPSKLYLVPELSDRLNAFAHRETCVRAALSWSHPNTVTGRQIRYRSTTQIASAIPPSSPPGRGCVFTFPDEALSRVQGSFIAELTKTKSNPSLTKTDVIQTLLWHHMTSARLPSLLPEHAIRHSKLLTPVNLRNKLKGHRAIDENYFGAAVDFASAQLSLQHLQKKDFASLTVTALAIHEAISMVDESYVGVAVALSNSTDLTIDVRDLQASNMNRSTGADMYITSWERMDLYSAELDLGLGTPDWVRKPWSRDPGSCIILPRNPKKAVVEVVIQMTENDMARLLNDRGFMAMVSKVVE